MNRLGAILALAIILISLALVVGYQLDPTIQADRAHAAYVRAQGREQIAPLWTAIKMLVLIAAGLSAAIMLIGGAVNGVRWLAQRTDLIYAQHGIYPAVRSGGLLLSNEAGAQRVAALVGGNVDRLNAGAVRPLLADPDPGPLLAAEPGPARIAVDTALRVDPHNPHTLLIGGTGSGKSLAAYSILAAICRNVPAEVLIAEREGVNWNDAAHVQTVGGYMSLLDAIEAERQRRAGLLRAEDVDHISALRQPPPYLAVLIEEAESIYSELSITDRDTARRFTVALRMLAAMGRKQGIMLICATQTGTGQVFDVPTRKNFGRRFLFRSEPAVGDAWGLPRSAGLAQLPPGTAYSLEHAGLVTFPLVARPTLPLSSLYREAVPGAGTGAVQDTVYRPEEGVWEVQSGIPAAVPSAVPPDAMAEALDPWQRRRIWWAWQRWHTLRGVQRELWPDQEPGGQKFYLAREIVRQECALRGIAMEE